MNFYVTSDSASSSGIKYLKMKIQPSNNPHPFKLTRDSFYSNKQKIHNYLM